MSAREGEQRDKYAAALFEQANPGSRWEDAVSAGLPDCDGWREAADAAMAVAVDEIGTIRVELQAYYESEQWLAGETKRLRAELISRIGLHNEDLSTISRLRAERDDWYALHSKALDENDRLRAELRGATSIARIRKGELDGFVRQLRNAEATISRVRAVLDEMVDGSLFPTGKTWADDIRAALDGDTHDQR